jgi:hypothetical protein
MLFQYSPGSGFQYSLMIYGNEANFYYEIIHCDYNWKPSEILKQNICKVLTISSELHQLFQHITTVLHYTLSIPNQFTQQLRISGNYMLKILNDDKDVVFTRKFILYENLVTVPMQVKRTRTVSNVSISII